MPNKVTTIFLIIFVVVVAGFAVYGLAKEDQSSNQSLSQEAKINITPASYDFGNVSQKGGVVTTSFTVENPGKDDLIINDMLSSCACTSASLIVNGQEGPRFGMHNNPKNWLATIKPGEKGELKVYYDPNVHKDFRGGATREITLSTNDAANAKKSVRITLNQTD